VATVQAGAGIVHDSVPEREWDETENKARALLTAIGRVRNSGGRESEPSPREGKEVVRGTARVSTSV
jgi:anthranilate synthase component 1